MEKIIVAVKIRNPKYNKHGTIDADIQLPDGEWVPFTATPDDPAQHGRFIWEHLTDPVNGWTIDPYVPDPEEQADVIRNRRAVLLQELDEIVMNPLRYDAFTDDERNALMAYRQALLDITEQTTFPESVKWPTLPIQG